MSRPWLIAYDIADDRRRRAAADWLGTRLERIQESVFEGWLAPPELQSLCAGLNARIDAAADSVRCYPIARREAADAVPPAPSFWLF